MITAREVGRRLEITVGSGEDALVYEIAPMSAKAGQELALQWLRLRLSAEAPKALIDLSEAFASAALGEANKARVEEEDLRGEEVTELINAAFLWNVNGGGKRFVDLFIAEGRAASDAAFLKVQGIADAEELLRALIEAADADGNVPQLTEEQAAELAVATLNGPRRPQDHLPKQK